jgi:PII-like signaling protein
MKAVDVVIARIYLSEGEKQLDTLMKRLHDWEKLRGVTVFRGISGYGPSGVINSSMLVDLSLHLPLVIEFFDEPAKVDAVIEHLSTVIHPGHIVRWPAQVIVD